MIETGFEALSEAVSDLRDGAQILLPGFCKAGHPTDLVDAFLDQTL